MKTGNKYSYLAKNTLFFTIANFSNKLIVFLLLPFYTSYLSQDEYAIIELISTTQQLIFPIISLDITEAIIRFGMDKTKNKATVFSIGLFVIIVGNIILAIGCGSCICFSIGNRQYIALFFLFSLVISLNTVLSSFLRTIDKVYVITIASITSTIVTTVLNIFLIAKMNLGIEGYYYAYIIGNFLAIFIMILNVNFHKYVKKVHYIEFKEYFKVMIKYALPLIPNAMFWWINSSLDRYFLASMSTLAYVGMYSAANKIPSLLSTVTSIFQQSWSLSIFSESESNSKQKFFDSVYCFYNIIMFILSAVLIWGSEFISRLLLSKEFYNAWIWVPWLIMGFYSNSISSFIGTEFTVAKKTSWILITTTVSAVVNIVFNILLISEYNCLGAAIATCISYFVMLELRVFILNRKFDVYINNKKIIVSHILLLILVVSVTRFSYNVWGIVFLIALITFLIIERNKIVQIYDVLKKDKNS